MSEAYECDRCGGLNSGTPHTLLTIGDGLTRAGPQDGGFREMHEGKEMADTYYDVCPGCRSAFEEWWEQ